MYKCTDCGKEYKDKPPFCECGNNNFEEIGIISASAKKETNKKVIKKNSDETTPRFEIPTEPKKDYTYIILSCILGLCILLIIIGVFHLKSISKKDVKPSETQSSKTQTNIPITPTKEQGKEQVPNPSKNQIFTFSIENNEHQNNQEKVKEQPKQTQKTDTKKAQPANKKTTVEPKKQTQIPVKPKQTQTKLPKITQSQSQPMQKQTQPQTNAPQTQVQNQTQSKQNTQTQNPSKSLPADKTLTPTPKVNTAEMKKELLQYKIALRNRITSDIDFTKVIGDGKCTITFKINSSGKLTNRAFAIQSDNDSLNDAVYSAVMNNPAYNPPPSGYKNETLHLTVQIYGGRFQVDLS